MTRTRQDSRETTVLSGATLVLPDRVIESGTLVFSGSRIVEIVDRALPGDAWHGHVIVPGFVDVHVHGLEGHDSLDPTHPIAEIAARMPRYGVTAFCPTTVACEPSALRGVFDAIRRARESRDPKSARVVGAHLESNFINPEYRGAQPLACLRLPPPPGELPPDGSTGENWDGVAILREIEEARSEVSILTIAPELEHAPALIQRLVRAGHRVSLGHSGATYEQGLAGIAAGARHATHLFNRMPSLHHRTPGLTAAILESREVAAEIVCDMHHVHPALVRVAVAAKTPSMAMAITDGTAGSGLPVGTRVALGGRPITVRSTAAYLDDGTLAGSTLTMDGAFRNLVRIGITLRDAAHLCATTPARQVGLSGHGVLAPEAKADFVILDRELRVRRTYIDGQVVWQTD